MTVSQVSDIWKRKDLSRKSVYEFDPASRSVGECGKATSWWLADYLARRSGKHISAKSKAPSAMEVENSLKEFERKLGWAAFFHKHGERDSREAFNPKLHVPSSRMAKPHQGVQRFMSHIRSEVEKRRLRLIESARTPGQFVDNPFERMAEDEIREKEVVILEADKDGCWVTTTRKGFEHLEGEILSSGSYIAIDQDEIRVKEMKKRYSEACGVLSKGTKALKRFLFSKMGSFHDPRMHAAKLRMKVKTHKPAGMVKARAIHDGSMNPMGPGAAFVSDVMENYVRREFKHVIKDSTEMVACIEQLEVDKKSALVTFDITDYYPTPEHSDLVSTAGRALQGAEAEVDKTKAFKDLTSLILTEQYVTSQVDKKLYKCNKGSAIGMKASGGLCDGCLGERETSLLFTRFQLQPDKVGIVKLYKRFKDDGLIVVEGDDLQITELIRAWNRISDWKIEKVTICRESTSEVRSKVIAIDGLKLEVEENPRIAYLDLELWFGERWRRSKLMDLRTYVKPTAVKVPLSYDSGHRESCKIWWPMAESRRFARTCGSYLEWKSQVKSLIARIPDYPSALHTKMLDPEIHHRRSVIVNGRARRGCVFIDGNAQHSQTSSDVKLRTIVCKMRYNRISAGINVVKVMRRFQHIIRELPVRIVPSWLNPGRHLRLAVRVTWPKDSIHREAVNSEF